MITKKYQSISPAIASYNFNDIADSTGMILFYGGEISDDSANTYSLSPSTFYSTNITKSTTSTVTTDTIQFDVDYDVEVNLPRIINGKVLVNVTGGIKNGD